MFPDRRIAALLLICISGPAAAAGKESGTQYGKTYAQILAMGNRRWMEYHAARDGGSSTREMNEAMSVYTDALRWRNDRLAPRASATVRRGVTEVRPLLRSFAGCMTDIAYYNAGGGTIWSNIESGAYVEAEETLYRLLGRRGKRASPLRAGSVTRALDALQAEMDHPDPELNSVTRDSGEARQQLAKGRVLYSRIVKVAGRLPRRGSDEILGFCLAQAKLGTGKLAGE